MGNEIKYQYTYFIQPFVISEKSYKNYIDSLLKNTKVKQKKFNPQKDAEIDTYFNSNVKEVMFKELCGRELTEKANMSSMCFEYVLEQNTQAKMGEEDGIFFRIDKIEIFCFKQGICFLSIKTFLDEKANFSDVLNFNYRFKGINTNGDRVKAFEKINLQSAEFKEKKELIDLIKELTQNHVEKEEFYTYSYMCMDGEYWNQNNDFSNYEPLFNKLVCVAPANTNAENNVNIIEKSKYIRFGIDKNSTALITNSLETYNYTKLPLEYENEYRYSLIYALYQKIALREFGNKLKNTKNYQNTKKELTNFINTAWAKEITSNTFGSDLYKAWRDKIELENTYLEIVNKYEMVYKNERLRKNKLSNIIIWIILGICVVTNIINVIILLNIK